MIKTAFNRNELLIILSTLKFFAKVISVFVFFLMIYLGATSSFFSSAQLQFFNSVALVVLTVINLFFVACYFNANLNRTENTTDKVFLYLMVTFWFAASVFCIALYHEGVPPESVADYIIVVTGFILSVEFFISLLLALVTLE